MSVQSHVTEGTGRGFKKLSKPKSIHSSLETAQDSALPEVIFEDSHSKELQQAIDEKCRPDKSLKQAENARPEASSSGDVIDGSPDEAEAVDSAATPLTDNTPSHTRARA